MNASMYDWYQTLKKPRWAPPAWVFGPVWTVLYVIIAVSFGAVFLASSSGAAPAALSLPFVLNLVFNLAYTPLQFGLRNNYLAAADVLLVLVTLAWALVAAYPVLSWVAWVNLPYLAWVSFATLLQLTITAMNCSATTRL